MFYFILLAIEIVILFLLSRSVSKHLSGLMSISLLSLLFLPGVIIHELSHLFTAMILFVPVGEMEFSPKKHDNAVKLGSVEIGKTDPIRRAIVGFAPVFVGLALVISSVYFFSANLSFLQNQNPYVFIAIILFAIYLLFAVSNTMFSSSKDMEGTIEIAISISIIFIAAYLLGFRLPLEFLNKIFTKEVLGLIQKSTLFLLAPIIVDLSILGIMRMLKK